MCTTLGAAFVPPSPGTGQQHVRGFFEIFDTRIDELTMTRISDARVGIVVMWTPGAS